MPTELSIRPRRAEGTRSASKSADHFKEVFMSEGIRILVVDDEASLRSVLAKLLSEEGHEVVEASSGEEALEYIKKEYFHLVITDLKMSGMSGSDLMKVVRKLNPDIQFIIITSYASLNTAITAVRLGAYDYLTRPFDDVEIVSTVVNRAVEKIRLIEEKRDLIDNLEKKNTELARANEILKEPSLLSGGPVGRGPPFSQA
jgi:DNA-binding NtrC family response regulator